jgi:hypothetical protein
MVNRKFAGLAMMLAMACGSVAMAEEKAPLYLAEASGRTPLMQLFDQAGIGKTLDNAGIKIYGLVEGSYTYSLSNPPNDVITGYIFNADHAEPLLNQINLTIERSIDIEKQSIDIGGKIEQTYGNDSRFTHSNGLSIYPTDETGLVKGSNPELQYDLNQAYVEIGGYGFSAKIGKWNTFIGYETVLPTGNYLFSHSFLFTQVPFTHTGILASYKINPSMDVSVGVSRGWDQFEDDNGELDYMASLHYGQNKYDGYFNVITGSEDPATSGWRTLLDYYGTYAFSDQLVFAFNADFGWEAQADPGDGGNAIWYGLAVYGSYQIDKMFTVNARAEIFQDEDGGAPFSITGANNTYYEGTLGVAIKPVPNDKVWSNLLIRPEVRFDYAKHDTFDAGTDHYQTTLAVDAIFSF